VSLLASGCACGAHERTADDALEAQGFVTHAKMVVYAEVFKHLNADSDWRKQYSAVFLEGSPEEQKIFVREFRRFDYPGSGNGVAVRLLTGMGGGR
jgi:hypothetical protein